MDLGGRCIFFALGIHYSHSSFGLHFDGSSLLPLSHQPALRNHLILGFDLHCGDQMVASVSMTVAGSHCDPGRAWMDEAFAFGFSR